MSEQTWDAILGAFGLLSLPAIALFVYWLAGGFDGKPQYDHSKDRLRRRPRTEDRT